MLYRCRYDIPPPRQTRGLSYNFLLGDKRESKRKSSITFPFLKGKEKKKRNQKKKQQNETMKANKGNDKGDDGKKEENEQETRRLANREQSTSSQPPLSHPSSFIHWPPIPAAGVPSCLTLQLLQWKHLSPTWLHIPSLSRRNEAEDSEGEAVWTPIPSSPSQEVKVDDSGEEEEEVNRVGKGVREDVQRIQLPSESPLPRQMDFHFPMDIGYGGEEIQIKEKEEINNEDKDKEIEKEKNKDKMAGKEGEIDELKREVEFLREQMEIDQLTIMDLKTGLGEIMAKNNQELKEWKTKEEKWKERESELRREKSEMAEEMRGLMAELQGLYSVEVTRHEEREKLVNEKFQREREIEKQRKELERQRKIIWQKDENNSVQKEQIKILEEKLAKRDQEEQQLETQWRRAYERMVGEKNTIRKEATQQAIERVLRLYGDAEREARQSWEQWRRRMIQWIMDECQRKAWRDYPNESQRWTPQHWQQYAEMEFIRMVLTREVPYVNPIMVTTPPLISGVEFRNRIGNG